MKIGFLMCFFAICATGVGQDAKRGEPSPWERSVVTVEVGRKQYDYYQPWSRKTARVQKPGLVLSDHQVLTTAEEMSDRTLVRMQKGGRGKWFAGEVAWID